MSAQQFRQIGRKILAIGRNYSEHAAELGNAVPSSPIVFMKSTSSYIGDGDSVVIPEGCHNVNHEVELGVVIGRRLSRGVGEEEARAVIGGYVLALDMTARDWQSDAKSKGQPWFLAKSFDTSCPVSSLVARESVPDAQNVQLRCYVNGELRQDGNTKDMLFDIPYLLQYVSRYVTLEPGDVLLTGTPAGVSRVVDGDTIRCTMRVGEKEIAQLSVNVVDGK